MTEKGIQHFNEINEFYKNSQKQNEKWFKYCPVRQIDNKLIFDFIDGQNLESLVDLYVKIMILIKYLKLWIYYMK